MSSYRVMRERPAVWLVAPGIAAVAPWGMRQFSLVALLLMTMAGTAQPPPEPTVRIGLNQNAATVTIRSASAFTVQQRTTRSATFASVLALDPGASGPLKKADLQYRMTVELDGDVLLVLAPGTRVRVEPTGTPLEIETRAYRGALEVFGNTRNRLTTVNELPLEEYFAAWYRTSSTRPRLENSRR